MFWASQRGGHRSGLSSRPHSEVLWDFQTVLLLLSLQVSVAFKRCPEMPTRWLAAMLLRGDTHHVGGCLMGVSGQGAILVDQHPD